jgi:hypothetical protein
MPKFSLHSKRDRLNKLIHRLEAGQTVQARDVDLVLTVTQKTAMQAEWQRQLALRKPVKPKSVREYEKALKSAAMWQGRLDAYKASEPTTYKVFVDRAAKQLEHEQKVQHELEHAKSLLKVISSTDAVAWLDRAIAAKQVQQMSLEQMPRSITSRSPANQAKDSVKANMGIKSINEIKLDALTQALVEVEQEVEKEWGAQQLTPEQTTKLKQLLVKIKKTR